MQKQYPVSLPGDHQSRAEELDEKGGRSCSFSKSTQPDFPATIGREQKSWARKEDAVAVAVAVLGQSSWRPLDASRIPPLHHHHHRISILTNDCNSVSFSFRRVPGCPPGLDVDVRRGPCPLGPCLSPPLRLPKVQVTPRSALSRHFTTTTTTETLR